MTSVGKYEGKDKRRERRRNHIAKDLMSPKYRQRVVPPGDRTRKWLNTEDEGYYDYDEPT
jgi:hypothetical protein